MLTLSIRDYAVICGIAFLFLGLIPQRSIQICVNIPPVAMFTYLPSDPKVYDSLTFSASGSYDPDGFIFSYTWNFGDGNITSVSVPIVTHRFNTRGNYNVNLTVMDNRGSTNSTVKTITVTGIAPPVAAFTWTPQKPQAGESVLFDSSNSTPNGGEIVLYIWDFGDGDTKVESEPHVTHVFQTFGNYTVVLNVTDSEGESGITINLISVTESPVADFFFEPTKPRVCTLVTFDASVSVPRGGSVISYKWNFGDDSPVEFGVVVTHRFLNMGEHDVSLNVTDSEGQWNMKTIWLKILPHIADLNEDGTVNIVDVSIFAKAFGSRPGEERWNAKVDLTGDEKVNILDGVIIARSYNQCIDPFDC